ncbi:MAG: hypothetical protein C5B49_05290 [Bdellovibrio sp.]|nr:MAG: hypothetical protein C5B49_05290 [Bdellovibrio sp.]
MSAMASQLASAGRGIYPTKWQMMTRPMSVKADDTKLLYYGGSVIGNARVFTVFWGNTVDSDLQKNIGPFYAAVVASPVMDWLNQYNTSVTAVDGRQGTNQTIGRGSYGGEFVIQPTNTATALDDKDIHVELEAQINKHVLPTPDANTLFMIHFPSNISITIDNMKSCAQFCAYHFSYQSTTYGPVYYGVMPDFKTGPCSFACGFSNNAFDITTAVSTHELAEAVTDPIPTPGDKPAYPQAWNTSNGQEIGDLCTYGNITLQTPDRTYALSALWDNSTGTCKSGPMGN